MTTAFPVAQPPMAAHASSSSGPAAAKIAPHTPPPRRSSRFAAFTIASTRSTVMSPRTASILMLASLAADRRPDLRKLGATRRSPSLRRAFWRRRARTPSTAPTITATTKRPRTTSSDAPSSLIDESSSTATRIGRMMPSGARDEMRAPKYTPGIAPTSSEVVSPSSKSPNRMWPSAAAPTSGIACTRSVPTS